MLCTYEQFIALAGQYGLLAFGGGFLPGFPTLSALTEERQWHTGDPETDPWSWRARAVREKRLAFGCLLGGHKGFVSRELYPLMAAACRPDQDMEGRYAHGTASRTLVQAYGLFAPGRVLDTGEIRRRLGVAKGRGLSRVDGALTALQREYLVAVCGEVRKRNRQGEEYGWPANAYCLAEDWAGDWLPASLPSRAEAREAVRDRAAGIPGDFDLDALERILFAKV